VAVLAAALASGCFSEHPDPTAPTAPSERCLQMARAAGIPPGHVLVGIEDHLFVPASVTVAPGQTVTWINCEPAFIQHTATSDDDAGAGPSWESPYFGPPGRYSHTFTQTGNNPYFCEPHPFMRGNVIVR
jgi:plastocyanin